MNVNNIIYKNQRIFVNTSSNRIIYYLSIQTTFPSSFSPHQPHSMFSRSTTHFGKIHTHICFSIIPLKTMSAGDLSTEYLEIIQKKNYDLVVKACQQYTKGISHFYLSLSQENSQENLEILKVHQQNLHTSLIELFQDLEGLRLYSIKETFTSCQSIIEEFHASLSSSSKSFQKQQYNKQSSYKTHQLCVKCSEYKHRQVISKMRKDLIFTQLCAHEKVNDPKTAMPSHEEQDDFQRKIYLQQIEDTLRQQQQFLGNQNDGLGRAYEFLAKITEKEGFGGEIDLSKENHEMRENSQNFSKLESLTSEKFKNNIQKSLKESAWNLICKYLKQLEANRKKKGFRQFLEASIQTLSIGDSVSVFQLQKQVTQLKKQLAALRQHKNAVDQALIRSIDTERRLKQKIITMECENKHLQERAKIYEQRMNDAIERMNQNSKIKRDEMSKIEKERKLEKQRLWEQELEMLKTIQANKKSMKSMRKMRPSINQSIDNQRLKQSNQSIRDQTMSRTSSQAPSTTRFHPSQKIRKMAAFSGSRYTEKKSTLQPYTQGNERTPQRQTVFFEEELRNQESILELCSNIVSVTVAPQRLSPKNAVAFQLENEENYKDTNEEERFEGPRLNMSRKKAAIRYYKGSLADSYKDNSDFYKTNVTSNLTDYEKNSLSMLLKDQPAGLKEIKRLRQEGQGKEDNLPFIRSMQRMKSTKILIRDLKKTKKQYQEVQKCNQSLTIPLPDQQNLQLFGGQRSALQYENNTGIWEHLETADKLMLDLQNSAFASSIQAYFQYMLEEDPAKYYEYMNFLSTPISYVKDCRAKTPHSSRRNIYPQFQLDKNFVKVLFCKILRFHRITHRNCSHVQNFLELIGYKQL